MEPVVEARITTAVMRKAAAVAARGVPALQLRRAKTAVLVYWGQAAVVAVRAVTVPVYLGDTAVNGNHTLPVAAGLLLSQVLVTVGLALQIPRDAAMAGLVVAGHLPVVAGAVEPVELLAAVAAAERGTQLVAGG